MDLLKHGAEAKLFITGFMGKKAVLKTREKKAYRENALDEKILKERLRTECTLLSRARKAGVRTPLIRKINAKDFSIITELIDGKTMKRELLEKPGKAMELCTDAGGNIAKLHSAGIVHGDLTTSNILLHKGKLFFVDFGLGKLSDKIEDKAVDLLAFKKMFMSTHFAVAAHWKNVEEEYSRNYEKWEEVLKQMQKVEARARYY